MNVVVGVNVDVDIILYSMQRILAFVSSAIVDVSSSARDQWRHPSGVDIDRLRDYDTLTGPAHLPAGTVNQTPTVAKPG